MMIKTFFEFEIENIIYVLKLFLFSDGLAKVVRYCQSIFDSSFAKNPERSSRHTKPQRAPSHAQSGQIHGLPLLERKKGSSTKMINLIKRCQFIII